MTPTEFREARHTLGLSCAKLAERIGVSDGRTIRRWEAGDRRIDPPAAELIRLLVWMRAEGIADPGLSRR